MLEYLFEGRNDAYSLSAGGEKNAFKSFLNQRIFMAEIKENFLNLNK